MAATDKASQATQATHRPGPWKIGRQFVWHRREFVPILHDGTVTPAVAIVMDEAQDMGLQPYNLADARLIAAAPDLLAALPKLLHVIDSLLEGGTLGGAGADYVAEARAAIAKATGEQS